MSSYIPTLIKSWQSIIDYYEQIGKSGSEFHLRAIRERDGYIRLQQMR